MILNFRKGLDKETEDKMNDVITFEIRLLLMPISKIINLMKSYTTYHIRKMHPDYLRKQFWKEYTFWIDGYFTCSVGNVLEEMLKGV